MSKWVSCNYYQLGTNQECTEDSWGRSSALLPAIRPVVLRWKFYPRFSVIYVHNASWLLTLSRQQQQAGSHSFSTSSFILLSLLLSWNKSRKKEMYMHEFHLLNKHFLGSVINQKAFFMSTGKVPSDVVRQCSQPESLCICIYVCV